MLRKGLPLGRGLAELNHSQSKEINNPVVMLSRRVTALTVEQRLNWRKCHGGQPSGEFILRGSIQFTLRSLI